jgi:hypothetical protein
MTEREKEERNGERERAKGYYWAKEEETDNCAGCSQVFSGKFLFFIFFLVSSHEFVFSSFSNWKHHCHLCGEIFCGNCSNKKRTVPEQGYKNAVRVCTMCYFAKKAQDDKQEVFESSKAFLTPGEAEMKERNWEVMDSLLRMYKAKVKLLEGKYRYDFFSSPLTDGNFDRKPLVLLLGQYSVGKTTFI